MWSHTRKQIDTLLNDKPSIENKPVDFDLFWQREKQTIQSLQVEAKVEWIDFPTKTVDVGEITFTSWDGTPLEGLIIRPKGVIESDILWSFHGLTGSKGLPTDFFKWTTLGLTVVSFDVRGQGNSPDYATYSNGARTQAWIMKGIRHANEHYYTNVYRDMLLQGKWLQEQAIVQPKKIGVIGSSQGGAIAAAAAGMLNDMVDFAMIDCPFMTSIEESVTKATAGSYANIKDYCKLNAPEIDDTDFILSTLSYVDTLYFGSAITCPVLMCTGLLDPVTPPASAFALYHEIASSYKHIDPYPQYEHETVPFHELKKMQFVYDQLNN